ncbi:hypothetical protein BJX68DRAFT_104871 [Aspergillus pseudodeflectus]|uniref:Uncharacterized protein n=1 Tax=Aspergillus pseudodeflectus TaxID=176178 RepID=A0ABR4K7S5_9EURO
MRRREVEAGASPFIFPESRTDGSRTSAGWGNPVGLRKDLKSGLIRPRTSQLIPGPMRRSQARSDYLNTLLNHDATKGGRQGALPDRDGPHHKALLTNNLYISHHLVRTGPIDRLRHDRECKHATATLPAFSTRGAEGLVPAYVMSSNSCLIESLLTVWKLRWLF